MNENFGRWPMPVKIGVLLGMGILISALGYWLIIQDSFTNYARLKAQEVTLKADFASKQRQVVNLADYRQQSENMKERFASMLKQLPEKKEMSALLEEISQTGIASGLKLELFAPQPEVTHDFYVELPIKISVIGNYFQLAVFLSRVAEMNQMVTLHEFTVEGMAFEDHKVVLADELVMNITAKIYRFLYIHQVKQGKSPAIESIPSITRFKFQEDDHRRNPFKPWNQKKFSDAGALDQHRIRQALEAYYSNYTRLGESINK